MCCEGNSIARWSYLIESIFGACIEIARNEGRRANLRIREISESRPRNWSENHG